MQPLIESDPRQVGRFQVIGRLGSGGMGRVYLATSDSGEQFALKMIHQFLSDDVQFRRRFEREVSAARRVVGAHTADLVEADPDARPPWMAVEYVEGPTLTELIDQDGPLSLEAAVDLAAGMAQALLDIHAADLVHRDLKPSNVLMAASGPCLIDFGIAQAAGASSLTMTGLVTGSAGFMSPEQALADRVTAASDVFALGTVLYFAATGRRPFGEGASIAVTYRVVHGEAYMPAVADEGLRALIADCLMKEPDDRPSAQEVLDRCPGIRDGSWRLTDPDGTQVVAAPADVSGARAPGADDATMMVPGAAALDATLQQPGIAAAAAAGVVGAEAAAGAVGAAGSGVAGGAAGSAGAGSAVAGAATDGSAQAGSANGDAADADSTQAGRDEAGSDQAQPENARSDKAEAGASGPVKNDDDTVAPNKPTPTTSSTPTAATSSTPGTATSSTPGAATSSTPGAATLSTPGAATSSTPASGKVTPAQAGTNKSASSTAKAATTPEAKATSAKAVAAETAASPAPAATSVAAASPATGSVPSGRMAPAVVPIGSPWATPEPAKPAARSAGSRLPQPLWATVVAAVSVLVAGTALSYALVVAGAKNDDPGDPAAPVVPGGGGLPTSTQNAVPVAPVTPTATKTKRGTVTKPRYTGRPRSSPTPSVSVTENGDPSPSATVTKAPVTVAPTTPDVDPPVTSAPAEPPPTSPADVEPTSEAG